MSEFPATQCVDCGTLYGHSTPVCRTCGTEEFQVQSIDSKGTVYASTIIRVPGVDHQGDEPFEVCLVDLGEGIRVTARIEGSPGLEPGNPVVYVERRNETFWFEPV